MMLRMRKTVVKLPVKITVVVVIAMLTKAVATLKPWDGMSMNSITIGAVSLFSFHVRPGLFEVQVVSYRLASYFSLCIDIKLKYLVKYWSSVGHNCIGLVRR